MSFWCGVNEGRIRRSCHCYRLKCLAQKRCDCLDCHISKLLVHGKSTARQPNTADSWKCRERLNLDKRPCRCSAAVNHQDRSNCASRTFKELFTVGERIEAASNKSYRGKSCTVCAYDGEFSPQSLSRQIGGISIDVAGAHTTHDERIDIEPVNERPEEGAIHYLAEPVEEKLMVAHHGGQGSSPGRSDENKPRRDLWCASGILEHVARCMPCRNDRVGLSYHRREQE